MRPNTFHIITFGCQMNVQDSQWLARALTGRGLAEATLEQAQVIFINTCSVREKPEQKVLSTLGRVRQVTHGNPRVLVAVVGCVAQQLGAELFERHPQVRLVAGSDGIQAAPAAVERLLADSALRLTLLDFSKHYVEREAGASMACGPMGLVNIMQGCDNFCAYCIVPFTRGRQKSRAAHAVLAECRERLASGARELTLLGQNVNAYGKDCDTGMDFPRLVREVAALPGLVRLGYVSAHPRDMREDDIAAFAELPALAPRLHLPLQAGSDAVLARMRRKYTRDDFLRLVAALRQARPDLALTTDLIVGFPGESEEDFQATLDMMRQCAFSSSFSFCYSDRPGTRASLFPDKIAPEVQQDRLIRLQALQDELSGQWLAARVGQTTELLMECPSPRQGEAGNTTTWQGRDPWGTPCHLPLPAGIDHAGQVVPVRIVEAKKHSLVAQPAGEA